MSEPTYPDAALDDALGGLIRTIGDGLTSLGEQDLKILGLCNLIGDRLAAQAVEIQELREGMVALSNRIEAVTRESVRVLRQP